MNKRTYYHALFIASHSERRPAYYIFSLGVLQKLKPPYDQPNGEADITSDELRALIAGTPGRTALLDRCDALYARASKRRTHDTLSKKEAKSLDALLKETHHRINHV